MQSLRRTLRFPLSKPLLSPFSTLPPHGGEDDAGHWGGATSDLAWDAAPSPSPTPRPIKPITKDHLGRSIGPAHSGPDSDPLKELQAENKWASGFADTWDDRIKETTFLINQAREPGIRGSYLKDSEKAEMYKKYKENPEVYTVERLAKEYRILRQRVHAILWLKRDEEEEEKLGKPLDATVELILDSLPECFKWHDREFHVAKLALKPKFKIMPDCWDGTPRDRDEVHYEKSVQEDEQLYQDFVRRFNFNDMRMKNQVKYHKYSRRRSSEGWNFMVEKLGPSGKYGKHGSYKFISQPDGSSRAINDYENMFVKRETSHQRRKIVI